MQKTKEQISYNMQQVKNKDSKIEVLLRKELWSRGLRYRKNMNSIYGKPDIVFVGKKIAVFCDGDFWHGKTTEKYTVKTHATYWNEKIKRNIERDLENTIELRDNGWTVLRFWESDIKKNLDMCVETVMFHVKQLNSH